MAGSATLMTAQAGFDCAAVQTSFDDRDLSEDACAAEVMPSLAGFRDNGSSVKEDSGPSEAAASE